MQNPANPQTLNRYSYCLNNPLKYVDQSGFRSTKADLNDDGRVDCQDLIIAQQLENKGAYKCKGSVNYITDQIMGRHPHDDASIYWALYAVDRYTHQSLPFWEVVHEFSGCLAYIPGPIGIGGAIVHAIGSAAEGDRAGFGIDVLSLIPMGKFAQLGKFDNVLGLAKYSKNNYRQGLIRATGIDPGTAAQAHHVLPQEFESQFAAKGINIHEPQYLTWWETTAHQGASNTYNAAWDEFLTIDRTPSEILDFGRQLMGRYNIPVRY